VVSCETTVLFYNLNLACVSSEFETPQRYQFQSDTVKIWKDRQFARKMNTNRSVFVFDFEK